MDGDGIPQRPRQVRPNWLPPGWLALTGVATGAALYVDARRLTVVEAPKEPAPEGSGSMLHFDGAHPIEVLETPVEVMHQWGRVTA